ncbi:apelin receptor early endogenous ligand [Acanthochromis polyacanthus]|uniref:apelin receptor early endogenous ligand n=1 Tax=Acanthochromis polyacanthus TaxID=80966 RepID=UPI0022344EC1|nr:apelin receptor early endogenous ligand [Acanthochromis polyacanthus]
MRIFNLLYLLLLLLAAIAAPISSVRPGELLQLHRTASPTTHFVSDFLHLRRKYHRHHCLYRRCMPLHSRVPFP